MVYDQVKRGQIVQFWGGSGGGTFRYGLVVRRGLGVWLSSAELDRFEAAPRGRRDFEPAPDRVIVMCSTRTGLPIYFSKRPEDLTHMAVT
jgi:hypothetical protein